MILDFEPGDKVINPNNKDWGIGQVQSIIKEKVTVNFENVGKKVINAKNIELDLVSIVKTLRNNMSHTLKIEIEVTNLEEVELAIIAKADGVLLDNMDIETTKKAVSLCKGKVFTEASGNMDLEKVRRVAETGVDLISVGALTHSVRALDLSFKLI